MLICTCKALSFSLFAFSRESTPVNAGNEREMELPMTILCAFLILGLTAGLQPLTEIKPDAQELAVFPSTLRAALKKAAPDAPLQGTVIHVVGATLVEDLADWSPLCEDGATIVLVGPQVEPMQVMLKGREIVERDRSGQHCVTVIRGLYSRGFLRQALGNGHPATDPDAVITVLLHLITLLLGEV